MMWIKLLVPYTYQQKVPVPYVLLTRSAESMPFRPSSTFLPKKKNMSRFCKFTGQLYLEKKKKKERDNRCPYLYLKLTFKLVYNSNISPCKRLSTINEVMKSISL